MKMKINRTAKTEAAAREILSWLNDDESTAGRVDPVVSLDKNGDLLFYNSACGTDDSETVLLDRLEGDSMGCGWESATAADVIDWLEAYCEY